MAQALPIIIAAGTILGAVGQVMSMSAQANAAEYDAKLKDRNAKIILNQTSAEMDDQQRENRRRLSAIRAQYGASGLDFSGSALDVFEDSAMEAELDVQRVDYQGKLRALGENDKAQLARMEASATRTAMPFAVASTLLSGAGQYAKLKAGESLMATG